MDGVGKRDSEPERRIVVRGRVQGVGYRWFAREAARRLGIRGWVKNEPDGAVVLEVAGPSAVLDALVTELKGGPPGAAVSSVETLPRSSAEPLADTFLIAR